MQNTYRVEALPPLIPIGVQTEEGVLAVDFDCSAWLESWPDMVCSAMHTRPGETESYPVVCSMAGTTLRWEISLIDTEIPGQGMIEIVGLAPGARKLSGKTCTHIEETSVTSVGDAPEVMRPFVDQILIAAAAAKMSATEALASAEAAKDAQGESAPPIMAAASGDVVTVADASARAASAVTTLITVQQEGAGTPSEDNIRPLVETPALMLYHTADYDASASPAHVVELPERVFGGAYDWVSGTLKITFGVVELYGTGRTWQTGEGNYYTAIPDRASAAMLYCDRYTKVGSTVGLQPGQMALGARNGNVCFGTSLALSAWKAKLDAEPLVIVYELAEPVAVQLAPQRVTMLAGSNALWSSTGNTTLEYIIDTKTYVDKHAGSGGGGGGSGSGQDGFSPVANVVQTDEGAVITITDKQGTTTAVVQNGQDGAPGAPGKDGDPGAPGKDGTSVTVKSVSENNTDGGSNIVTFSDGKTLTVKNGSKGSPGQDGKTPVKGTDYFDGAKGDPGKDGVSPTVTASKSGKVTTITIKDATGTKTATINDGQDGSAGVGIKSVTQTTTSSADGGSNVITVTKTDNTTSTFTVKNGSKGSPGANGSTPVKGTDYFTAADKADMVSQVKAALPTMTLTGVDADGVTHTYTIYGS